MSKRRTEKEGNGAVCQVQGKHPVREGCCSRQLNCATSSPLALARLACTNGGHMHVRRTPCYVRGQPAIFRLYKFAVPYLSLPLPAKTRVPVSSPIREQSHCHSDYRRVTRAYAAYRVTLATSVARGGLLTAKAKQHQLRTPCCAIKTGLRAVRARQRDSTAQPETRQPSCFFPLIHAHITSS